MKSAKPKVAHELLGKPLIRWVADAAKAAGTKRLIAVVGHQRDIVSALVPDATCVVQQELLGTGHAIMIARDTITKAGAPASIVILCGDTPLITPDTIKRIVARQQDEQAACCALSFEPDNPSGYGRIIRASDGTLERIVEEKDANGAERAVREVNSGMYCFDVAALVSALDKLTNDNAQGEYYLTDTLEIIKRDGGRVIVEKAKDAIEPLGINDRVRLADATSLMQERINHAHMLAGVTMLDPSSVWVGPDVTLEQDVTLLPLTFLQGDTHIASGSVVGPNSRVNNSNIGHDCAVDESVLVYATLEDRVSVGPRAYLRPGTIMRQGSRAGTHVEIKNSDIGENSKVPHLSYIGDTKMGAGVNIGASSITCNYDGVNKNHTTIGDRAFIGSDTMFVAPVNVGNDVVTGAGSVITKDVPDGSLAIGRSKQANIEGWAKKKKGH
jgi:bifunctional UDP-N-acetylglucosamine pyrophosphorylase/glucosamine-1-phosphate N-acetyltransferase